MPYPAEPLTSTSRQDPKLRDHTSQLFVAGDPGNARDFLYRQLDDAGRTAVDVRLSRAPAGAPVTWQAEHRLVISG